MDFVKLTDEQRAQFNDHGYLIVRNALDPDTCRRLIAASDRLITSDRLEMRQRTADGLYDGFRNVISMDDAFVPLLTWPTTVPLVVQLFGPNLQMMTSHLIYKYPDKPGTPRTHREPGWHRDIAGTPEDLGHHSIPRMEMKIAYYFTDLSEPDMGVTLFSPGSNQLKTALRIEPGKVDPENVVEPGLRAGDAVFFENRTWHAGATNLSSRTRKGVMFGYGYRWLKPMDYVVQSPELVAKVDDIGRQMLGETKDAQGRYVYSGLDKPLRDWCAKYGVTYRPPEPR